MAGYRRKDGRLLAADETVVTVDLRGFEYCKLLTLDISANQMREVLADFCEPHEIRSRTEYKEEEVKKNWLHLRVGQWWSWCSPHGGTVGIR